MERGTVYPQNLYAKSTPYCCAVGVDPDSALVSDVRPYRFGCAFLGRAPREFIFCTFYLLRHAIRYGTCSITSFICVGVFKMPSDFNRRVSNFPINRFRVHTPERIRHTTYPLANSSRKKDRRSAIQLLCVLASSAVLVR